MVKNQNLPAHLQEKDSSSEHDLILYEYHDQPPSSDQGLAFQTHALQMKLFGPFYMRTQYHFGSLQIVSLHFPTWNITLLLNKKKKKSQ